MASASGVNPVSETSAVPPLAEEEESRGQVDARIVPISARLYAPGPQLQEGFSVLREGRGFPRFEYQAAAAMPSSPPVPEASPASQPESGRSSDGYVRGSARGRGYERPRSAAPLFAGMPAGVLNPEVFFREGSERKLGPEDAEVVEALLTRASAAYSTESPGSSAKSVSGGGTYVDRESVDSGGIPTPSPPLQQANRVSICPLNLRWSQASVSCCLSDKATSVEALSRILLKRGWNGDPLTVVRMPDGRLTSDDNRRLVASVLAVVLNSDFTVPAEIHNWDESTGKPLFRFIRPDHDAESQGERRKMMSSSEANTMLHRISELAPIYKPGKGLATYGDAIFMKMYSKKSHVIEKEFIAYGFGYTTIPMILQTVSPEPYIHESHLRDVRLNAKMRAASEVLRRKERPTPSQDTPELRILSKSAQRREKKKNRRAQSSDVAIAPQDGGRLAPRPETAPPGAESDKR